jgi:molybdopterin synthase sulfur carrier subunit
MKVRIKYFASIREAIGIPGETRETQVTTLAALRDELISMGAPYAACLERGRAVRMAQNQVMSEETAALLDGAELAFFPPVTGG